MKSVSRTYEIKFQANSPPFFFKYLIMKFFIEHSLGTRIGDGYAMGKSVSIGEMSYVEELRKRTRLSSVG